MDAMPNTWIIAVAVIALIACIYYVSRSPTQASSTALATPIPSSTEMPEVTLPPPPSPESRGNEGLMNPVLA
jgi:hypothetical protein